jgi:hypothetical protein
MLQLFASQNSYIPMTRTNSLPPNMDTEDMVKYSLPLRIQLGEKMDQLPSKQARFIYGESLLDNVEEEVKMKDFKAFKPYSFVTYEQFSNAKDEEEALPPQIKNKNMDYILDEWCLSHPPKYRRSRHDGLDENWEWIDKRLDWLSNAVEEQDNDEKNKETFGL